MSRKLRPEETRLWRQVLATVRPTPGRALLEAELGAGVAHDPRAGPLIAPPPAAPAMAARPSSPPDEIEPGRRKRLARGRDVLEDRLDLHGLTQEKARTVLEAFLRRVHAEGGRQALIITGKGVTGDGVLRRRTPEWLAGPGLRDIIAGYSPAARHHGGDGAFYVALKRR